MREAWADGAQAPGTSAARFILSRDEATAAVQAEARLHPLFGVMV